MNFIYVLKFLLDIKVRFILEIIFKLSFVFIFNGM